MNVVQRIAQNTIVLLVARIVSIGLGFFFLMYTARYLGTEEFGVLSFAIAFTGIFGILMDLGLNTLIAREISKEKTLAGKYIGNVAIMKLVFICISFSLIAVTINFLEYPEQTIKVVYLIAISIIFSNFSGIFYSVFQAFEKMEFQSIGVILSSILMLAGVLIAINQGLSLIGFASIYLIVNAIVLCYSFVVCIWKFTVPKIEIDFGFWKETIREAWPMGGMAILIMIYFRIDVIMLSLMVDNTAVGIYSASYRISEMTTIIPSIFVASIFPVLSKYHKNSNILFMSLYEKSVKYMLYLALPVASLVTLLAKPIIYLIFGSEFAGSVIALQVIIWSAAIMYVTMILGNTIIAAKKQMVSFKFAIVAALLNIILNWITIPKYSYIGASAATVATEAFGLFVGVYCLSKWGYKLNIVEICYPPFIAICLAGIIAVILINVGVHILLIFIIVALIYSVILYTIGIKDDDKQLFKNIFDF